MIENYYYSEDAEILDYTEELRSLIHSSEVYSEIIRCFKEKDMRNLARLITLIFKHDKEKSDKVTSLKQHIENLENRVSLLEIKVKKREDRNIQLEAEVNRLQEQLLGSEKQKCLDMKNLYMAGMSLRKIGEILHCDKSTVKRKLIKMGVQIRK